MATPSGRPLVDPKVLAEIDALPDWALVNAHEARSWKGWYGSVAIENPYASDADFSRGYETRLKAIAGVAADVRADLHGEGNRWAPHWDPYDVQYRLLPYWRKRAQQEHRAMAKELLASATIKPDEALSRLPGIYQAVGKLQDRLGRCKAGSKRYEDIWNRLTKLEDEGAELSAIVRLAVEAL